MEMIIAIGQVLGIGAGVLLGLLIIQFVILLIWIAQHDQQTEGNHYFGLRREQRAQFKEKLRLQRRLLFPLTFLLPKLSSFRFENASFSNSGLAFPKGVCTPESIDAASKYEPQPEDVFVATQMRCGTTWMQYLVYEILCRGEGKLVENGQALYSISPWIESRRAVPLADAPLIGEAHSETADGVSKRRIIKTHLPGELCPFSTLAKYVYVTRDPGGCFASCLDFLRVSAGEMAPDLDAVREWFIDPDKMWWGGLPDHVAGWHKLHQEHPGNVYFVRFENLKSDVRPHIIGLNQFLDRPPLTADEVNKIESKCSFASMKSHSECFEMMPPSLFQSDQPTLVSGSARRNQDLNEEVRNSISSWYQKRLGELNSPLGQGTPTESR